MNDYDDYSYDNMGSITIGNVVIMSASTDTGDVSEQVFLDIELENRCTYKNTNNMHE